MRPALLRMTCLAALAAALAAAPGCKWGRASDRAAASAPARMSGPEASRAIARAREHLSARQAGSPDAAIRLADMVIANCDVPRYVSEGFLLKAAAYRGRDEHENAAAAARRGVQKILTSPGGGGPDPAMLTALKMLLAAYVESAVAGNSREEVLSTLNSWRAELRSLYEEDNSALAGEVKAVDETFDLLAEMAEQHIASGAPEVAAQEVVRRYIRLFNAHGKDGLVRLFAPDSAQAGLLAEHGAHALAGEQIDLLGLGSAIKVAISHDEHARAAVATCDLMAVSPAGWATIVRGVRFSLEQADDGSWRIREIAGLP